MNRELSEFEKLVIENAYLRLEIHDFVTIARKVVDSRRIAGASGYQALVSAGYLDDLKAEIVKYDLQKMKEQKILQEKHAFTNGVKVALEEKASENKFTGDGTDCCGGNCGCAE